MNEAISNSIVLELAADITVAWLSNPDTKVRADELPAVIGQIHAALAGVSGGDAGKAPAPDYVPAVSARRSLASRDHIISMIDGKPYKMLKRHIGLHGLTPAEYRERYGLKSDYPMVAPSYAEKRRNLAVKIGLGRKPVVTAKSSAGKPRKPRQTAGAGAEVPGVS